MQVRTILPLMLALLVASGAGGQAPFNYRFEEVRSKVMVERRGAAQNAAEGMTALPGDLVRTGWRGYTVVGVPDRAARFEIYGGTTARLAANEPGVLIVLERGRLKAIFDAITGEDERLVRTPGALLAVRGTRYGIEVDPAGRTTLAVFEGRVEVRGFASAGAPLIVTAGELCDFGPHMVPMRRPMSHGMNEHSWGRSGAMPPGGRSERGIDGHDMPGMSPGKQGRPPSTPPMGHGSGGGKGKH